MTIRHFSIRMPIAPTHRKSRVKQYGVTLCFLILVGCGASTEQTTPSDRMVKFVKEIGTNPKRSAENLKRDSDYIQQLAARPKEAVVALVGELEPVSVAKLDEAENNVTENDKARHVIWCLRALRYITGKNILARTSYKFTDSELDKNRSGLIVNQSNGKVCFFAEWMSRGTTYLAPVDAQLRIIDEWKVWLRTNVSTFKYREQAEFNEWYFGGPE